MPNHRATVSLRMLQPGARQLARASQSVQQEAQRRILELLTRGGIDPADLASPDARIPQEIAFEEAVICAEVTGDRAFNLHAAQTQEKGDFGLYEYVSRTSATLGESMKCSAKYLPLITDGAEIDIIIQGDTVIWRHRLTANSRGTPEGIEFVMTSFFVSTAQKLGFKGSPIEVHFTYDKPAYIEEYETFFMAPMRFNMEFNQSIIPVRALELPLVTADPALHAVLIPYGDQALDTLALRLPFTQRVRKVILDQLTLEDSGLKKTAEKLRMSERTLRRGLESEGTRYSDLVDDVRKALARTYLTTSEYVNADIAQRLGFTSLPAFYRAFKRWYGFAPTEYRKASARNPFFSLLNP
jgi:AraC-like DNA-binding protein